jgi:hypothetical protein
LIPALQPARTLGYTVAVASISCGVAAMRAALMRRRWETAWWFAIALVAPVSVMLTSHGAVRPANQEEAAAVSQVADWADRNTWGSSMFLFPDAGRALYPGVFRAESRRALWVDWYSGAQMKYFESAGEEWWERWRETMAPPFSAQRLQAMLALPIDYFVVGRGNRLAGVQPVFQNRVFVVYDATDLRNAETLR